MSRMPEVSPPPRPGRAQFELWTVRTQSCSSTVSAGPTRTRTPPCERTSDTSVVQALHLMNSPKLHAKVTSDEGRAAGLAAGKKMTTELVEELYLLVYCVTRAPSSGGNALKALRGRPAPTSDRGFAVGAVEYGRSFFQGLDLRYNVTSSFGGFVCGSKLEPQNANDDFSLVSSHV